MLRWENQGATPAQVSARRNGFKGASPSPVDGRVGVDGKFFTLNGRKWYLAGLTYGPFAPNESGEPLPTPATAVNDLARMRQMGANAVRLYHVPLAWFADEAQAAGLKLFVDIPWQKHRCFFEDYGAQREALQTVPQAARSLGNHPATFALSVGNEIPKDIVRFYGARRVERFIGELLDAARQQGPKCLMTYTNYPSTEFLCPPALDFLCLNVYLEQSSKLGPYLDRLQHLAGSRPLILGEFGMDSFRHGETAQAAALVEHVRCVFQHGLAGSFVFSYTDDWFTGGHKIENWGFGVTDRERQEKPAAAILRRAWATLPHVEDRPLPKVSVVVCSFNGGATLEQCLRSLRDLDYPDFEVMLVDDGSTDDTPLIASRFPSVRYIQQQNRGLSAARNVGANLATGNIVAYTDSDCVADEKWLYYLVTSMLDQKVDAIGGPNIPPPDDCPIARCVAASPGGPSHVMLDDRRAEHVPGCNMAFDRQKLLDLGGFDVQFRVAGDDVDICWRLMDAGLEIGFAPAAMVWHHRRNTVHAYVRQQRGYGRAEGMLYFKHPQRFNAAGQARWNGVIYGEGTIGLPLAPQPTWHGRFGTALFQAIYPHNRYSAWAWPMLLEWQSAGVLLIAVGVLWTPLVAVGVAMLTLSIIAASRSAWAAPLAAGTPWRYRLLVGCLHLLQPVIRSAHRYKYRLEKKLIPAISAPLDRRSDVKRISFNERDLYWRSNRGRGREELLHSLVKLARECGWNGVFDAEWESWDTTLFGGWWHMLYIRTATEQLGGPKLFTRIRCKLRTTRLTRVVLAFASVLAAFAGLTGHTHWAMVMASVLMSGLIAVGWNRRRCWDAFFAIAWNAGHDAGLEPVEVKPQTVRMENQLAVDEAVEPAGVLTG